LKRAADDDDAGSSGTTSDIVNRTEPSQLYYSQGIVTHNRFACLSQDENITDDYAIRTQPHDQENALRHMTRDENDLHEIQTPTMDRTHTRICTTD